MILVTLYNAMAAFSQVQNRSLGDRELSAPEGATGSRV